jgi:integrase
MRGSLKQRSKGSWSLILDLGYEPDAAGILKRRQKWHTFRGTKKQAEDKLTELLNTVRTDEYVDPSKLTVGQWLTEWIDNSAKPHLRPASYVRYAGIIKNHLLHAPIARILIQKLTESHIEAYYATIPAGSRPLHHTVLRRALRKAKKQHLLAANPASDLDHVPQRVRTQDDARINCWSAAEAKAFLLVAKADGPQTAALYATALDAGARKNELCGLRWEHVDLESASIRIVQQLTKPGLNPTFGPPKSGRDRDITLSAETIELLRQHKRSQAELKMANRRTYRDCGLVFAKEYGDLTNRTDMIGLPIQSNNLGERQFDRLIKAAQVKRITFHGMRHTCATLLLRAGEPVHVVAKRLGHARVETTLENYAHVLPDMQRQAAATIGGLLHG